MNRKLPMLSLIALIALSVTGCGGGTMSSSPSTTTSQNVSVSTSPPNVNLVPGARQQYNATVSNSPNKAVTWSATAGTISPSGLFTAPTVSITTPVVVTATSQADTKRSSSVNLIVTQVLPAPPVAPAAPVLPASPALPTAPPLPAPPIQHVVSLSWQPSADSSVVSYNLYRSTISGASFELLASAIGEVVYADQTVQSGTNYYYVVTAVDEQGRESAHSFQKAVTIP
jgi:hypothetical protein